MVQTLSALWFYLQDIKPAVSMIHSFWYNPLWENLTILVSGTSVSVYPSLNHTILLLVLIYHTTSDNFWTCSNLIYQVSWPIFHTSLLWTFDPNYWKSPPSLPLPHSFRKGLYCFYPLSRAYCTFASWSSSSCSLLSHIRQFHLQTLQLWRFLSNLICQPVIIPLVSC